MAKTKSGVLSASAKKIDPTLDALFSTSSGPVKTPEKTRYQELIPLKSEQQPASEEDDDEEDDSEEEDEDFEGSGDEEEEGSGDEDDEELSELSVSEDSEADERDAAAQLFSEAQEHERKQQKRKRKQDEFHDLESKYFQKLADEEPPATKRQKQDNGGEEAKPSKATDGEDSDGDVPMHESLAKQSKESDEIEKASRTVFLSNVSMEAVRSKKAKKQLLAHLSSALDKEASPPQTVESLRFRSVAFSTAAMPKRAAYITKATMEATTQSANAYAVYSSTVAARAACAKLNGTVILDRHLRVDSVAHPAEVDHRRCVFVGNLGFVDDETVLNTKVDEDGKEKTEKRKRTKVPMDVEEGLWRTFGEHAGKVESVRVVRDNVTRVGKGIAYVQFYDGNAVEAALLLNGKKFPPMLPRDLRVSRCKAPHKTARAMEKKTSEKIAALKAGGKPNKGTKYVPKLTAEQQTMAGRAGKLLGHSAAAKARGSKSGAARASKWRDRSESRPGRPGKGKTGASGTFKSPETIIFEGRRASSTDGKPKDLKMKVKSSKKKSGSKPKKSAR